MRENIATDFIILLNKCFDICNIFHYLFYKIVVNFILVFFIYVSVNIVQFVDRVSKKLILQQYGFLQYGYYCTIWIFFSTSK